MGALEAPIELTSGLQVHRIVHKGWHAVDVAWLVRGDDVLATLHVADSFSTRLKGLLGRDGIDGAFLISPAKSVHTFGMRFAIDVAFCSKEMTVVEIVTMLPNRVGLPRLKASCVIEAEAGAFERWRLRPGDQLELRG